MINKNLASNIIDFIKTYLYNYYIIVIILEKHI